MLAEEHFVICLVLSVAVQAERIQSQQKNLTSTTVVLLGFWCSLTSYRMSARQKPLAFAAKTQSINGLQC